MQGEHAHTMMESKMLTYCKLILEKVSFDKKLLRKEYRKSLRLLTQAEYLKLKEWVRARFIRKNSNKL